MWNYGKLNYNTKYPWESTPIAIPEKYADKEQRTLCESQQYLLFGADEKHPMRGNLMFWCGEKDDVLYRRLFFEGNLETEQHWFQAMNLADFPVERGIFRVDKMRLVFRPVKITLGAYGFPDNPGADGRPTEIIVREEKLSDGSTAQAVILIGHDHAGVQRQMAMTCYSGWEKIETIHSQGTNPDSRNSIVVYASMHSRKQYGGAEPYLLVSQVITAELTDRDTTDCVFSDEELFPVRQIICEDTYRTGAYAPITICMKNGKTKKIDFEGMEAAF